MGVRGLTTFVANRSEQYLENYELYNTYCVLDGNSIASQLYKWHCKCNDCFGGDYDKFANVIANFFQLLFDCNVVPLVVFDGAYEAKKLQTVYSRMKNKIRTAKSLNSVTEGSTSVFPLFLREVFVDLVLKLGVKCVRCDFESDGEAAFLARTLGCPLLSYDSDFYIFDVLYVPFSTMELRVKKKRDGSKNFQNYISCQVYRVEKFLNSFGGLDKVNLPILAVLLGNDYVKKSWFAAFYQHLKIRGAKNGDNLQQRGIKSVIGWLKNETPESALRKILGRFKMDARKRIAGKIQSVIDGYCCTNSDVLRHLKIEATPKKMGDIELPQLENIEFIPEEVPDSEEIAVSSDEDLESTDDMAESGDGPNLPKYFRENYRNCLYPSSFMDMLVSNTYYCVPQVEDFDQEHSHLISLEILSAIHKILRAETGNLICVARNGDSVKKFYLPGSDKELPQLSQIQNMSLEERVEVLLQIMKVSKTNRNLDQFPKSWHLFLIAVEYWLIHSGPGMSYFYSVILCAIVLNYVDKQTGFCRSTKTFSAKFGNIINDNKNVEIAENNIQKSTEKIDFGNSVSCMKKLIHYFQMEIKVKNNSRLFNRKIVHSFAQFQSCLLHVKYLNAVLNFPFPALSVADFYDGTFLFNMTANLSKRGDVKAYVKLLLEDSPVVYNTFELMIALLEEEIGSSMAKHEPSRKRKKKKKAKDALHVVEEAEKGESDDEEYVMDANNKFSLLSFINK